MIAKKIYTFKYPLNLSPSSAGEGDRGEVSYICFIIV